MARTVGSYNRSTREVKALIDEVGAAFGRGSRHGMVQAMQKLFERAHGVQVERQVAGEPVVYDIPPDVFAIKTLLEFRFGKAKESVEVSTPSDGNGQHYLVVPMLPPVPRGASGSKPN